MPVPGTHHGTGDMDAMMNTSSVIPKESPPLSVWGLVGVIVFYIAILLVGLYASWRSKSWKKTDSEEMMLAGRDIGLVVGIFTMTGTWVGGGFINGTAEYVYKENTGLAWTQATWGYSLSLVVAGLFFAKPMREAGYVTMLDPFEKRFGRVMSGLLYIPALLGETFWTAAILSALGASLSVILGLDNTISIIISACIAVFYTVIGGLYSVALTDVIQLICIFVGLWLGVGFAFANPAVSDISTTAFGVNGWLGQLGPNDPWVGNWIDSALLLIFGGIPWQAYFQRVLSSRSAKRAQYLSFIAAIGCMVMSIPSVLIGAIAKSTDWNATELSRYYTVPLPTETDKLILPLVLQYLTPGPVAVIGLGAVSAAVMSSADSSVLSASTMFAKNVYKPLRLGLCQKKPPSEREVIWTMRVAIILVGSLATAMAILINSIYGLWYLCSDLLYVALFPQLLCVIYVPFVNTYGSSVGYVIALFLRLTGGEREIKMHPLFRYPNYVYDMDGGYQLFPFKTMTMLISLSLIILVSLITDTLFRRRILSRKFDIFKCFENMDTEQEKKDLKQGQVNPLVDSRAPDFILSNTKL